jgi:HAD superfamily hydrolase (TIGR01509 family)
VRSSCAAHRCGRPRAARLGRVSAPIRAVLFDCDGVLQRPGNDWAGEIGTATGLEGAALDAFLDDVSAAEQPLLAGAEPFAVALTRVLADWHLPARAEDLLHVWQHLVVDAGMLDAVRELRAQGLTCGIATNQHRERAAYMRRELGYEQLFDPMVISSEIGVAKPDPAYFRTAVDRLGLPAGQVLFVDDVLANVESARGVGLVAEHFAKDAGRPELDRILALHDLAEPLAA